MVGGEHRFEGTVEPLLRVAVEVQLGVEVAVVGQTLLPWMEVGEASYHTEEVEAVDHSPVYSLQVVLVGVHRSSQMRLERTAHSKVG